MQAGYIDFDPDGRVFTVFDMFGCGEMVLTLVMIGRGVFTDKSLGQLLRLGSTRLSATERRDFRQTSAGCTRTRISSSVF